MEKLKLHFYYIIGIMTGLLILIATFKWSELKDFTTYLSNAATFTSLALAVVAIIISVVAGSSVARDLGSVSQVTNEVRQSVVQVSGLLTAATSVATDARQKNTELGTLISNLQQEFNGIRTTSEALAASTTQISNDLASMPGRFERLENKLGEATGSAAKPLEEKGRTGSESVNADHMYEWTSISGCFLLHAIALANKTGKPLDLLELAKIFSDEEYLHGYFVASSSLNLFTENVVKTKVYKIRWCNPKLYEAGDQLRKKIAASKLDTAKQKWNAEIGELEAMFA